MGVTNPFGRYHRCHIIHLLLQSLILILITVFALLLLPLPFINGEIVECRADQPVFVPSPT
jgi:hypothetical protein